ncbi:MAG: hypothetical protein APR53_06765 [Methanoculleus sp. SDB]|nr:MAG: hypothetical protein APR53_06765 [Methanoculleus sp. SDB]
MVHSTRDIEVIPVEIRWRLAAKALCSLPLAYNWAFRDRVGGAYSFLEKAIFSEAAKETYAIAQAQFAPKETPEDIARMFGIVSGVLFGPGYEIEHDTTPSGAEILRLRACPLLSVADDLGFELERAFDTCDAYTRSVVGHFGSLCSVTRVKAMCRGDPYCEIRIGKIGALQK